MIKPIIKLLIVIALSAAVTSCGKKFSAREVFGEIVPDNINAEYVNSDLAVEITSSDSIYGRICEKLELENPQIKLYGYQELGDSCLVKIYAEDMRHMGMYLLLIDQTGQIVDYMTIDIPADGEPLDWSDGVEVAWFYHSDFFYYDQLEQRTVDCEVRSGEQMDDTLYVKTITTKYRIENGKIVEESTDTLEKGMHYEKRGLSQYKENLLRFNKLIADSLPVPMKVLMDAYPLNYAENRIYDSVVCGQIDENTLFAEDLAWMTVEYALADSAGALEFCMLIGEVSDGAVAEVLFWSGYPKLAEKYPEKFAMLRKMRSIWWNDAYDDLGD